MPAPVGPAVAIQGGGACSFKASLAKGTSNIAASSFDSPGRATNGDPSMSSGQASTNREGSSLISVIEAPPEAFGSGGRRNRTINITLAARGGFRAGQTIPIALFPASTDKPKTAYCFISYGEEEVAERKIIGKRRQWSVTSGTLRIDAISPNRLAFSILHARCSVPSSREDNANNLATGVFTMNGKGIFTLEN